MKNLFISISLFIFSNVSAQWDTLHTNCSTNFRDIVFVSPDTGFAVGGDGNDHADIRMTTNAGVTWTQPVFPSGAPKLNAIRFLTNDEGWAVGDTGLVLHSTDHGMTWNTVPAFCTANLLTLNVPTNTVIYVAGTHGAMYKSSDDGATWSAITTTGTVLSINDMHIINAAAGFICGDGGFISATGDGGATWNFFAQPYGGFFMAHGYDYAGTTNNAFCVGNNGMVIYSTDAGMSWNPLAIPTTKTLNKVRFGNDRSGVMCGEQGVIFVTTDGGVMWNNFSMASITTDLYSASFDHDSSFYICGDNGKILRNWYDLSTVHENNLNTVSAKAYPNPFNDELNIAFELKSPSEVTIEIADITGRIISSSTEGSLNAGKHLLTPEGMRDLTAGIYFVKVIADENSVSLPVIKQ